jgi:LCP family protein required for cell wall assembly
MSGKYANTKTKSKFPLILTIVLAAIIIIGCVGAYFLFFMNSGEISKSQVKKDIKSSDNLKEFTIGDYVLDFTVSDVKVKDGVEKDSNISFDSTVALTNQMYSIADLKVTLEYEKKDNAYSVVKEEIGKDYTLSPVGGFDEDLALKEIKSTYKNSSVKSHKTDIDNKKDTFVFNVTTTDKKGTVKVIYKFDDKNGWVADSTDDQNLNIKNGKTTTVKVGGVSCYTNSAVKNIILLGTDADDGARRSDSMILVSIDSNNKEIKFSSFMRDTYVSIDGYGKDKLNAAFAYGGAKLAVKTIEKNYGVKIDNYITTGFSNFKGIVDALGGVDINLDEDECGYINWQLGKNGQTAKVGEVEVKDGVQKLNGQQALWFCRDRGSEQYSGDDFTRTSRQRRMLMGLVKSYKTSTVKDIVNLTSTLKKYVETDLKAKDLKWLAQNSPKFFEYKTTEKCYPESSSGWTADTSPVGAWIISIDSWDDTKSNLAHYIYTDLKD